MTEFIRVKDNETGHEFSVPVERFDADRQLYTPVDKPAAGPDGIPIPPRYKTTVAQRAAEKKATSQASTAPAPTGSDEKAASPAIKKEN